MKRQYTKRRERRRPFSLLKNTVISAASIRIISASDSRTRPEPYKGYSMKTEKQLRKEILNLTKEFYRARKQQEPFIPGETQISYGGRVYNEKEMMNLVDAALDFWLSMGRFAEQFEKEFASFLGVKYCLLTNSGSSANLLAVSALTSPKLGERRLKPGD